MTVPRKNLKQNYSTIQRSHFWVYIQKRCKQELEELFTHLGSQQRYSQQPKSDEWIKKMWYTVKYYSALKGKDILTPATTWMNLEDLMLSERSQSQKDKCCAIPLT